MKARLQAFAGRINARTLRERILLFAAAAAAMVLLLYSLYLNPLLARREALRAQLAQQRDNITGIDGEISSRLQAFALDPNAAANARLAALNAETGQLSASLRALQTGVVAPERMAPLLGSILRANPRLRLVSMKTMALSPFGDDPKAMLLYRHGVQLTVRGNYLDMVNYLDALEAMPTRLLWGGAALEVEEYPNARLTLTVYTLSLDKKWMKL
jgi:MSHA biogenesis protein MshJ